MFHGKKNIMPANKKESVISNTLNHFAQIKAIIAVAIAPTIDVIKYGSSLCDLRYIARAKISWLITEFRATKAKGAGDKNLEPY